MVFSSSDEHAEDKAFSPVSLENQPMPEKRKLFFERLVTKPEFAQGSMSLLVMHAIF